MTGRCHSGAQLAKEAPGDLNVQVELGRALVQTGEAAEALQYLDPGPGWGISGRKGSMHALAGACSAAIGAHTGSREGRRGSTPPSDAFQARNKEAPAREAPHDNQ